MIWCGANSSKGADAVEHYPCYCYHYFFRSELMKLLRWVLGESDAVIEHHLFIELSLHLSALFIIYSA